MNPENAAHAFYMIIIVISIATAITSGLLSTNATGPYAAERHWMRGVVCVVIALAALIALAAGAPLPTTALLTG